MSAVWVLLIEIRGGSKTTVMSWNRLYRGGTVQFAARRNIVESLAGYYNNVIGRRFGLAPRRNDSRPLPVDSTKIPLPNLNRNAAQEVAPHNPRQLGTWKNLNFPPTCCGWLADVGHHGLSDCLGSGPIQWKYRFGHATVFPCRFRLNYTAPKSGFGWNWIFVGRKPNSLAGKTQLLGETEFWWGLLPNTSVCRWSL